MSANSKIEWTTHTFNPWIGCTKVSPGCAHCYAETEDKRRGWTPEGWGKGKPRKRTTTLYWNQALKWEREALEPIAINYGQTDDLGEPAKAFYRPRVFPSLCDWLDDEVPIEWLADFLNLIRGTPHLDWLLLTKRPELWRERLCKVYVHADRTGNKELRRFVRDWVPLQWRTESIPANVWLGVSVEDQPRAEERVQRLLETPAAIRFLSCEPLLGPINLRGIQSHSAAIAFSALEKGVLVPNKVDWVIVGGESGPKARPCPIEFIRDLVSQCKTTGTPVFVKQLGAVPTQNGMYCPPGMISDRKGGDPAEWPEDLRVREMPAISV